MTECCGCQKQIVAGQVACDACWSATGADRDTVNRWALVVSAGSLRRWLESPQGPRPASGDEIVRHWIKKRLKVKASRPT
jgi:hypothetical protein